MNNNSDSKVPDKVQEQFHKNLFEVLLAVPKEITTVEEAAAWGIAKGAGLILQEVTRDSEDIKKNMLLAIMVKEKPELADLFPGTGLLLQRLLPYLNKYGMTYEDLAKNLINKETFEADCDTAAGSDPDLQKVAAEMKELMKLTKEEFDNAMQDKEKEEEEFTEEY